MLLLIDADSALYRAGCANETRSYLVVLDGNVIGEEHYKKDAVALAEQYEGAEIVPHKEAGAIGITLYNLRQVCKSFFSLKHTAYEMYFGGKGNFRLDIFPEYKQDRDPLLKPLHLTQMKKHLEGQYGAIPVDGEEADDRVSWRQMQCIENGVESCIVTIDKDLNNTQGYHYNWLKEHLYYVSPEEADLNFARQCLMGDSTDGITGLPNVGKETALSILPEYREDWLDVVKQEYENRGFDMDYLTQQGRALWMRRKPDELWVPDGSF